MPEPALLVIALILITGIVLIASFVALRIKKARHRDRQAQAIVKQVLGIELAKNDLVTTTSRHAALGKYAVCEGCIVEPPYFKDNDKVIAVGVHSYKDGHVYTKKVLVYDGSTWKPSKTEFSKSRANKKAWRMQA